MKQIKKLEDLTPDTQNANKGSERGGQAIEESLQRVGAARSIVVDRNGVIIAGNHVHEKAVAAGLGMKLVKTNGHDLVVVQREDIDAIEEPAKAKEIAYRDNRANELSLTWDAEQLSADLDAGLVPDGLWTDAEMAHALKSLELQAASGGAPDADTTEGAVDHAATADSSHVRMVQLFLTTETQPAFLEWAEQLQAAYGTDNLTDTVYECLKRAVDGMNLGKQVADAD